MRFRTAFVPHDISGPITGASGGPLAGLTAVVKDMYDIAGYRTGGGNPEWLEAHPPAAANASAVQKILDAGATIVGKTVCDEFFYSVSGANAHYGTPVNPRAFGRLPGGSSSGSASAAASGACDFALGSDTGGSVRIPASFCGLYGLRPTHGRVDLTGAMAMAPVFDVGGWFSSAPSVFRKVGAALLGGGAVREPIQHVMVAEDAFAQADPEAGALLRGFLQAAAAAIPTPSTGTLAPRGFDQWREIVRIVQAREVWKQYGPFVEKHKPRLGPGIRERIEFASTVSENDAAALRSADSRGARADSRHREAGHRRGDAYGAVHRAADQHAGFRAGFLPHSCDAADVRIRHQWTAASEHSRRDAFGLSDWAFVSGLGRWRRSAAGPGGFAGKVHGRCGVSWSQARSDPEDR